ncbi:MAG TPA: hydantoinase/oxoprolinase family protein [Longimicrobiales bacterium]|nr:hydantoinase/oxoprolinase family protein [Longimicrobiales bacterium]
MSSHDKRASTAVVAVDTGGTFTDLILCRDGGLVTLKVPSTPADPAQAVLDGIRALVPEGEPFLLLHGSTVATNALLERRGARVVLVTNQGFEDVIEIGRQNRPQLYALVGHRPPPLVAREDRIGIPGRLGPRGDVVEALDPAALEALSNLVDERGAQSVAVCLLHSYANADHERTVAEALIPAGLPMSVSSELLPEFREYERTSTTVVNAYVAPVMSRYLGRLSEEAGAQRVTIMGSNGGALPVERARREPVHTVLSGPAGGVVGALAWAQRAGHENALTFDMGGTSTDVSLCPGRPLRSREFEIDGQPVAIPVLDIHTVGAGGGSLARLDAGGALRVGPQSAGADPGPISYGRGGTGVTVTDAHVWLGRLPVDAFLGGKGHLDRESIQAPLQTLADRLGISLEAAAEGVLAVADTAMERALRVISVERGYDPADFAVVAFGGAGALHVAELTRRLGASRALVPPDPGLLSAYGMLASPVTREVSRTVLASTVDPDLPARMASVFTELEAQGRQEMLSEGADADLLVVERWVDARYEGQSFELRVPAVDWVDLFHTSHGERYGYRRDETPVEAVTLRVVITAPAVPLEVPELAPASGPPETESSPVFFGGTTVSAQRVWRQHLRAGHVLRGPVIVQEYSATTWVPPEWRMEVDRWGCIHLIPDGT